MSYKFLWNFVDHEADTILLIEHGTDHIYYQVPSVKISYDNSNMGRKVHGLVFGVRYKKKIGKLSVDHKKAAEFIRVFVCFLEVSNLVLLD